MTLVFDIFLALFCLFFASAKGILMTTMYYMAKKGWADFGFWGMIEKMAASGKPPYGWEAGLFDDDMNLTTCFISHNILLFISFVV
ncbi:uncharacterized protein BKA55DRAFT_363123 [Fusarium redolens]|uniref:Uncharacterized protein n=1 Tax=Fusarium redolens TaxID=48865 RepID=A0A9P9KA71_FUSRE|nr:uncharacterized protein BKA55DRAFT_363123 [Fusarium redolens]KAH7249825.1 hypothetical protein BKA55DRAFT_363123 [Fusarium redolens]